MGKNYKGGGFIPVFSEKMWGFKSGNLGGSYPILDPTGLYESGYTNEHQYTSYTDPWSCVPSSIMTELARLLNWKAKTDPEILEIHRKFGCVDANGNINFSQRFAAWMCGIRKSGVGTSYEACLDAIRKSGVVGESVWPATDNMTEAEYFTEPTEEVKKLALEWLEWFQFNYENVKRDLMKSYSTAEQILEAAQHGTVVYCCDGDYQKTSDGLIGQQGRVLNYNHSVGHKSKPSYYNVIDSYEPFEKKFIPDYKFGHPVVLYCVKKKFITKAILVKQVGSPAVYLRLANSGKDYSISDQNNCGEEVLSGGDMLKAFCGGDYKNARIQTVEKINIAGAVKLTNS